MVAIIILPEFLLKMTRNYYHVSIIIAGSDRKNKACTETWRGEGRRGLPGKSVSYGRKAVERNRIHTGKRA
jgi:hypothetical protein